MSKTRLTKVLLAGLTLAVVTTASTTADAQKRVRWKMQSAFGSSLPHLGTSALRFSENVKTATDGKFQITPNLIYVADPGGGGLAWEDDALFILGVRFYVPF